MENAVVLGISLKFLGALVGAIIALVFQPPKSRSWFLRRMLVGLLCGLIFADPVRERLGWTETWQMWISSAAITSMLSWFALGTAVRVISKWAPK